MLNIVGLQWLKTCSRFGTLGPISIYYLIYSLRGHPLLKTYFLQLLLYQNDTPSKVYEYRKKNLAKIFFKIFLQNWLISGIFYLILDHFQNLSPPAFFKIQHRYFGNTTSRPIEKNCREEILISFSIFEKIKVSKKIQKSHVFGPIWPHKKFLRSNIKISSLQTLTNSL